MCGCAGVEPERGGGGGGGGSGPPNFFYLICSSVHIGFSDPLP